MTAPTPNADPATVDGPDPEPAPPRELSDAAKRALAEAEARRAAIDAGADKLTERRERAGRGGLEPVRYGDWEIKGLASDF